ncbi:hypothetical protein [uncultured Fretibacterium sp.]|uniref:hypothetical protein n=1 Tax=uncultured Fretibacterium sp. TaxID=1678694 RepID=UPI002616CB84|nr:hypothetical protein [uncultured Fretibacterium sp.]
MDDRTHVVSDEEFVAAVVDRANDLACEGERDLGLLRGWAELCGLPEPGDVGPVFWEGFVLGGAVVGLEIAGFRGSPREERAAPVLRLLKGGKDQEVDEG